jgi:hypothetical protein
VAKRTAEAVVMDGCHGAGEQHSGARSGEGGWCGGVERRGPVERWIRP